MTTPDQPAEDTPTLPTPFTVTSGCTCYTCDRETWTAGSKQYPHPNTCPTCHTTHCHGAVRHDRHGLTSEQWHANAQPAT